MTIPPITTWADLFSLHGFAPSVPGSEMKRGDVKKDYEMGAQQGLRPCGLAECHTPHKKGYVIVLPDGRVSHVGWKCGKTHFDVDWSAKIKMYRAEQRENARVEALDVARAAGRNSARESHPLVDAQLLHATQLLATFDAMPEALRNSIVSKAIDGDPDLYGYRAPTPGDKAAYERERKPVPSQIRFVVTRLDGLAAFGAGQRVDSILRRILQARESIAKVSESPDSTPDQIHTEIRKLHAAFGELERSYWRLVAFFKSDNVAKLSHLGATQRIGYKLVRLSDDGRSVEFG